MEKALKAVPSAQHGSSYRSCYRTKDQENGRTARVSKVSSVKSCERLISGIEIQLSQWKRHLFPIFGWKAPFSILRKLHPLSPFRQIFSCCFFPIRSEVDWSCSVKRSPVWMGFFYRHCQQLMGFFTFEWMTLPLHSGLNVASVVKRFCFSLSRLFESSSFQTKQATHTLSAREPSVAVKSGNPDFVNNKFRRI
jgi:hypothetical protein